MHYAQLKFTCILNKMLFSYVNYPKNTQIYSKPSSVTKSSLPRCILHWINFLIILTQNNTMISGKYPKIPVKMSKIGLFFVLPHVPLTRLVFLS